MIGLDRDALICDLAEEYSIYDMRSLPARLVATLAVGLRDDSRIKSKLSGREYLTEKELLIEIHDRIVGLMYSMVGKYEEAPSLRDELFGAPLEPKDERYRAFESGADFDAAWNKNGGQ